MQDDKIYQMPPLLPIIIWAEQYILATYPPIAGIKGISWCFYTYGQPTTPKPDYSFTLLNPPIVNAYILTTNMTMCHEIARRRKTYTNTKTIPKDIYGNQL